MPPHGQLNPARANSELRWKSALAGGLHWNQQDALAVLLCAGTLLSLGHQKKSL
jgi:hypothetical protein